MHYLMSFLVLILFAMPAIGQQTEEPPQPFFQRHSSTKYERQEFVKRKAKVVSHKWEQRGSLGTFEVMYLKSDLRLPVRYGDTVAEVLVTSKGNLETSSHFQLDVETGLDVVVSLPNSDEVLRMRLIADGLKEVRLTYIGPRSNMLEGEVDRFFQSVRFLD